MFGKINKTLRDSWRSLLNSFWFVPAAVSLPGPLLALLFLLLDHTVKIEDTTFFFGGGATEASTILSTIAGSLITVAGLAFSITIVVLQLVSSQYTPRALRGFLQDRVTQVAAGGFFAIFAYSLIVLTSVRDPSPSDPGFIPAVSITVAMGLGFLGLVLLLIFIHHIGRVIQVSDIAARLAIQTMQAIDQPYPDWAREPFAEEVSSLIRTWRTEETPALLRALSSGYVQHIALSHLMRDIAQRRLQVRLLVCPGDFVTQETVIAEIWPARAVDELCQRTLLHSIYLERERDIAQDSRFGVRQLADIALRALSLAVNDPTTGVLCINYLQAVLECLVRRQSPLGISYFANRMSWLEVRQPAFQEYLDVFSEIGHYAGGNRRVTTTLVNALTRLRKVATRLNIQEYQDLLTTTISALATQDREIDTAMRD